jgi:ABC-2 type transport system ATP-binding protein
MDEAEYCHRLALMYRGKVIALGTPAELKRGMEGHTLMTVEIDDLLEAMTALEGVEGVVDVAVFGNGLHVRLAGPEAQERVRARLGSRLRRFERIDPSMEDVFVALIEAEERRAA